VLLERDDAFPPERAVAEAWPALCGRAGEGFAARSDAFARATPTPPPAFGFGHGDGLAFARSLAHEGLNGEIRVELLLARAVIAGAPPACPACGALRRRASQAPRRLRKRRGVFAGAAASSSVPSRCAIRGES
jgi:hypothetical protein